MEMDEYRLAVGLIQDEVRRRLAALRGTYESVLEEARRDLMACVRGDGSSAVRAALVHEITIGLDSAKFPRVHLSPRGASLLRTARLSGLETFSQKDNEAAKRYVIAPGLEFYSDLSGAAQCDVLSEAVAAWHELRTYEECAAKVAVEYAKGVS